LIASIHEDNINSDCGQGDMWSSYTGALFSGTCCFINNHVWLVYSGVVFSVSRFLKTKQYR